MEIIIIIDNYYNFIQQYNSYLNCQQHCSFYLYLEIHNVYVECHYKINSMHQDIVFRFCKSVNIIFIQANNLNIFYMALGIQCAIEVIMLPTSRNIC